MFRVISLKWSAFEKIAAEQNRVRDFLKRFLFLFYESFCMFSTNVNEQ